MVVGFPENVVNVVGKNVVDELGSNRENVVIDSKNVVKINQEQNPYPSGNVVVDALKTQWTAVQAARQMVSEKPLCIVLARLYNEARTYFQSES